MTTATLPCKAALPLFRRVRGEAGFSLVELSIVLVILGLLVGGILGGQSLIRAAELRSITTELQQWQTAVNNFREKYRALPGDMRKATRIWQEAEGNVCADVAANAHDEPLKGGTCNGSGDNSVASHQHNQLYETFLFWQHLQLAGLIPGQFTGVRGEQSHWDHVAGENAPAARYGAGAVWTVREPPPGGTLNVYVNTDYGRVFGIGIPAPTTGYPWEGMMTPAEAWSIDDKMDDGLPAQGNVIAFPHNSDCTTGTGQDDLEGEYRLDLDSNLCGLLFGHAF